MQSYLARVYVNLKSGILDPQGKAIQHALGSLGFDTITEVRVGKMIELRLQAADDESARVDVHRACEKLLANPVIEDFRFEIEKVEENQK